jgi:uncharacterized damage-inducible protein DinB
MQPQGHAICRACSVTRSTGGPTIPPVTMAQAAHCDAAAKTAFCVCDMTPGCPKTDGCPAPLTAHPSTRHAERMRDPVRPYRQLARNARLANRRLGLAIAALQPGEWAAPRSSFFPSLRATMNHIHVVDLFYIDAVQGGTLGPAAWANPEPYPDPTGLFAAQATLDQTVVSLVDALTPDDLSRAVHIHRQSRIQTETLADTLMHVFLHDQHHRGQVHAMLSGTSIKPPQLDEFFMADDARFRDKDLAELGWDEATICD